MPIEITSESLTETAKASESLAETRRGPPPKVPAAPRAPVAQPATAEPTTVQARGAPQKPVMSPGGKYRAYLDAYSVTLPDRTWPERRITQAPIWCSVDLRDGNQALIHPMNIEQKLELFRTLAEIGFKEIEIGFPSASQIEFEFCRTLIDQGLIPEDVYPQVLTQARSHLIERSFEALQGAKQAILHIYNSVSELQRRVVFHMNKTEIKSIAVRGVELVRRLAEKAGAEIRLEYSPESFTGTELPYALEVCEAVIDVWEPTPQRKIILNLPATVEMATPNVYADQIEWFCRHVKGPESVLISLHPHNDRGTAVAAAELALMAGADRVEGTLFGNGERTGNVDIVTLALNMFSQGIDPKLNFRNINAIRAVTDRCTKLPVHPRHPYAGDLVFTAFSGSHQDAISKGMRVQQQSASELWEVPYLPIDPQDIGRSYEKIIQINSQSGKGGVAFVMDTGFQRRLPKAMHPEFAAVIQRHSEETGVEVSPETISQLFAREFLEQDSPFRFVEFRSWSTASLEEALLTVEVNGELRELSGLGNGPIHAAKQALLSGGCPYFEILDFRAHARSAGADADAIAYIQIETKDRVRRYGAGIDANTVTASIKSLLSALNRALGSQMSPEGAVIGKRRYTAAQFVPAMQDEFGCTLPEAMHAEFVAAMQHGGLDGVGATAAELWNAFTAEYLRPAGPYRFVNLRTRSSAQRPDAEECWLSLQIDGKPHELHGFGNGPVNACVRALIEAGPLEFDVVDFHEDSLGHEPDAESIAYVQVELADGVKRFGVGVDRRPNVAATKALLSALNRASERDEYALDEFLHVMRSEFQCELPQGMHREFRAAMQKISEHPEARVSAATIWNAFERQYLDRTSPYRLLAAGVASVEGDAKLLEVTLSLERDGQRQERTARSENVLDAARHALLEAGCPMLEIVEFHEHARGSGADAEAVAFVQVRLDGVEKYGAGIDRSTTRALIKALLSAVNRQLSQRTYPPAEAIHLLQAEYGCELPEAMYAEVREVVRSTIDAGGAFPASFLWGLFAAEFVERVSPYRFVGFHAYRENSDDPQSVGCTLTVELGGRRQELHGTGNGPIDACVQALQSLLATLRLTTFEEHARTSGADAEAVAYIQIELEGRARFGVGIDHNTTKAAIKALLAAINRAVE
jgi:2-isopropylmalate synthase